MTLLLIGAFAWTTGVGFMSLAVPLYAYHLGFSGMAIGSLVALPQLLHLAVRLLGGALLDRIGERKLLLASYAALIACGPLYYAAQGFNGLFAAQLLAMVSRSIYWISAQTYASRLVHGRNIHLGWLAATNNAGQILGMVGAGVLIAAAGYAASFLVLSALGSVAFASALALRPLVRPAAKGHRPPHPFAHFSHLLREPAIYFAMLCSFLGAVPVTLTASFYPLYLTTIGAGPELTGYVSALRGVGAVVSGLALARFLSSTTRLPLTLSNIATFALLIGATPLVGAPLALAPLLLALGAGSAIMEVACQLTVSAVSKDEARGSAMALGNMGFNLAFLLVPLFFGFVSDWAGLDIAFYFWGLLLLLLAPATVLLHRRSGLASGPAPL